MYFHSAIPFNYLRQNTCFNSINIISLESKKIVNFAKNEMLRLYLASFFIALWSSASSKLCRDGKKLEMVQPNYNDFETKLLLGLQGLLILQTFWLFRKFWVLWYNRPFNFFSCKKSVQHLSSVAEALMTLNLSQSPPN